MFTNNGTVTVSPVSSVAGLSPPEAVFPFNPGSVIVTSNVTFSGGSTPITFPSHCNTEHVMPSVMNFSKSPDGHRHSSNVSMSMNTYWSSSLYVYCIWRLVMSGTSNVVPFLNVSSFVLPFK